MLKKQNNSVKKDNAPLNGYNQSALFAYQTLPNISFKGINRASDLAKRIAQIPLEDKISVAIDKLETGKMLVVSRDLKEAQKQLMSLAKFLTFPLERIYAIIDSKINDTIGILRTSEIDFQLVNLSDNFIGYEGDKVIKPRTILLTKMNTKFNLGGEWILLKPEPKDISILDYEDEFIREFDFSQKAFDIYKKHNVSVVEEMIPKKSNKKKGVTFADVGGQDEVIKSLKRNIIHPINNPEAFQNYFSNKGFLLYGPPGTGKSLIAEALASEVNASYFKMAGTEFSDKYVGESERKCRELFEKAVDAQPSIIFIDEVDALGRSRGGQDQYGDKLLNQVLACMTDLKDENVYVLAATNNLEALDKAFVRSGRFGTQLKVDAPNLEGVKQILTIHTKGKPIDSNLDMDALAQTMTTLKMTGADIAVTVKEAHTNAFERSGIFDAMDKGTYTPAMLEYFSITQEDFEKALDGIKDKSLNKRKPIGFNQK